MYPKTFKNDSSHDKFDWRGKTVVLLGMQKSEQEPSCTSTQREAKHDYSANTVADWSSGESKQQLYADPL